MTAKDNLPDVRDGLTRLERVILVELARAQRELGRESVPTDLLYGRVVERCNVSVAEMQAALSRLAGRAAPRPGSAPRNTTARRRRKKVE